MKLSYFFGKLALIVLFLYAKIIGTFIFLIVEIVVMSFVRNLLGVT